jgi:hypothetical protein
MELGIKITLLDYRKLRVCLELYLKNIIFKFKIGQKFHISFCQKCVFAIFLFFFLPLKAFFFFFYQMDIFFFKQTF